MADKALVRAIETYPRLNGVERSLALFYAQACVDIDQNLRCSLGIIEVSIGVHRSRISELRSRLVYLGVLERIGSMVRFSSEIRENRKRFRNTGTGGRSDSGKPESIRENRKQFRETGNDSGYSSSLHDHDVLSIKVMGSQEHEDSGLMRAHAREGHMELWDDRVTGLDDLFAQEALQPPLPGLNVPDKVRRKRTAPKRVQQAETNDASMSDLEREAIEALYKVTGWPMDMALDLACVRKLCREFPEVDTLAAIKAWAMYKLDVPLVTHHVEQNRNSKPRAQLHMWFTKSIEYGRNLKKAEAVIDLTDGGAAKMPTNAGVQVEMSDKRTRQNYMTEEQFDAYCATLVKRGHLHAEKIPQLKASSYDNRKRLYRI